MIVLQIIGWVLLGFAVLSVLILLMPVSVAVVFRGRLGVRVSLWGIPVFTTPKRQKMKPDKSKVHRKSHKYTNKKAKQNLWKTAKERYGFRNAISSFASLAKEILKKLPALLRHIHFRNLNFSLDVAATDAAQTAIHYGIVCTTVYPIFSALFSIVDCKAKKINISADFNHTESKLQFSFAARTRAIFLLITAFSCYRIFKKWSRDLNE